LIKKSPGPPGWELMQQASTLLIEKRKLLKSLKFITWENITPLISGQWHKHFISQIVRRLCVQFGIGLTGVCFENNIWLSYKR